MKGRHLLTMQEFNREEVHLILDQAYEFKKRRYAGEHLTNILQNRSIAMIFEKPSTRTRVSTEVAVTELGGKSLYLSANDIQLTRGETIEDTARVLTRYVSGIVARLGSHDTILKLAENSRVPVINALTPMHHPMQILADLMTIKEKKGKLEGLKLAFVGDGNNICHSLLIGCSIVGMNISVGTPRGYGPSQEIVKVAQDYAESSGSDIAVINDPVEAVKDADVIYTDVFVSMGQEAEAQERLRAFPPFQVNRKLTSNASEGYIFLHCLPAHRGQEVATDVIDDPEHSAVWDEAENRLHVAKSTLALLI
ncbi:MAG: ornithine carbamoyltransferase [Promethearchaeati archaeon SRVP18_Atabeyarchaeia-1]